MVRTVGVRARILPSSLVVDPFHTLGLRMSQFRSYIHRNDGLITAVIAKRPRSSPCAAPSDEGILDSRDIAEAIPLNTDRAFEVCTKCPVVCQFTLVQVICALLWTFAKASLVMKRPPG